jgi:hypothetical protein
MPGLHPVLARGKDAGLARTRHKKGIDGGNPITELLVVRHDATGGGKVSLQIFDLENGLGRLGAGLCSDLLDQRCAIRQVAPKISL